ncbi:UNVERIFIED_CONTAM: hypothetical protein FKN15_000998 [Acipenser sinensis]
MDENEPRPLYMDFQATTPMDPRVLDAMLPYQVNYYGNPHSRTHAYGWESESAVELARKQVADLIGADPREIIFTSGATESNNISIKQLEESFRPDTSLVSIMTVNNEIGVIQPIKEIGHLCQSRKIFFHTDAAQAAGKIPLDVNDMKIDLMSISGHKIYGPKGVGAVYVRRRPRVRLEPLQSGGGQERGLRSGTVPTPLAVGLGAACEIARQEMKYDEHRVSMLSKRLIDKIMAGLPDVIMNGDPEKRYSGCINLSFAYVEGESLLMALKDVALSSGSACTSASLEPSYVLRAIGTDEDLAHSSIRFGIGRFTTEEEVDYTAEKCILQVKRLREMRCVLVRLSMAVVIRLQGLPIMAGTMDIRHFFSGLIIPDGGVHIVGGEHGEAFIVFATDEDARLGMMRTGGAIKGSKVSLLLSSKTEMQNMIELSRRRFETGNLEVPPTNSGRAGPPVSTGGSGRGSLPAMQGFSSPSPSVVTTASSVHEAVGNKNMPTFSTAGMGSMPPNFSNNFSSPNLTMGSTMATAMPPMNSVPPMPPLPTMPSLPPMPSIPPMPVPPPVSALPPVPPVAPLPAVPPVPPMTHMPTHMSSLPPFNPGVPPPLGPMPSGMGGSGPPMPMSNPNHMFLGPMTPINPLGQMNPPSHMKPPLVNPDELYVYMQGIPFSATEMDVRDFFHGLPVDEVNLLRDHLGRVSGRAFVKFFSPQDTYEALKHHTGMMGQRYIEVSPATERQWMVSCTGMSSTNQGLSKHSSGHPEQDQYHMHSRSESPSGKDRARSRSPHKHEYCVYLKGLPYEAEKREIFEFFKNIEFMDDTVYIAYGPNGRATGEGFVEFRNEADYKSALGRHMQYMGSRFIQVHPISKKGMLEKIDSIRKRMQGSQQNDQKGNSLESGGDNSAKICAHISNIPYNVSKSEVQQFLEGIQLVEDSLRVLVDANGQGLGQAVVQFRSEEEALKAERLHRRKLNGRDAFVRLVTSEHVKDIENNPPPQVKRGHRVQGNPSGHQFPSVGDDFSFMRGNSGSINNGPPFNPLFSAPGNGFGGLPPPLPPIGGLGDGPMGVPPPPPGVGGHMPGPAHEPLGFRPAPGNTNAPPGFGEAPEGMMGPPPFDNGPRKNSGPPGWGNGQSRLGSSQGFGSGSENVRGPPGLSPGPGNSRPTVVKIHNMPFTVSVDEILDFFYGYQVLPGSVCLQYSDKGMATGEAMVAFESHDEAMSAVLDLNDRPIGSRKMAAQCVTKVELSISCQNLIDKDVGSKSDPLCVLLQSTGEDKWVELDRTERVKNCQSPEFSKKLRVDYFFEKVQKLKFGVYDIDNNSVDLGDDDYLGGFECTLGQIVSSRKLIRPLELKKGKPAGKGMITVSHEFALNFNPSNPYCQGITGIVEAYRAALPQVKLYGPTNFSPIINHVARIASGGAQQNTAGQFTWPHYGKLIREEMLSIKVYNCSKVFSSRTREVKRTDKLDREARRLGKSLVKSGEEGDEEDEDDDDEDYDVSEIEFSNISFTHIKSRCRFLSKTELAAAPKVQSFQINVNVLEAQKLIGVNIDPLVYVKVGDEKKHTATQKSTNCPFYNENFMFEFQEPQEVLFDKVVEISVAYKKRFSFFPTRLGTFKIDISTVYNQPDHRFYQKWAVLTDPKDTRSGIKGYVKGTVSVVAKGDSMAMASIPTTGSQNDDIEKNLMLPKRMPAERPWAKFLVKVYKAEGLPSMNAGFMGSFSKIMGEKKVFIDPYVQVTLAGQQGETSVESNTNAPEWNEQISFIEQFPPLARRIKVQVLDDANIGDVALATHFLDLQQISNPTRNGFHPTFGPSWINLYGSPQNSVLRDIHRDLNEGLGEGIFYRGRILLSLSVELYNSPGPTENKAAKAMKSALSKLKLKKKKSKKSKEKVKEEAAPQGSSEGAEQEESMELPSAVTVEMEEIHPLPENFVGEKEEFLLFGSLFEATMIDPSIGSKPVTFELSIGNYGKAADVIVKSKKTAAKEELKEDMQPLMESSEDELEKVDVEEPRSRDKSVTQPKKPQPTEHDRCIPLLHEKPCLYVWNYCEDHSARLYNTNWIGKMADRLEYGIDDVEKLLRRPRSHAKERLKEVLAEFVASCRQYSLNADKKTMPRPNNLDKCRVKFLKQSIIMLAKQVLRIRHRITKKNTREKLNETRTKLKRLRFLAKEPQSTLPDVFIWMLSNNKRVAYARIPSHTILFSMVEEERGKDCGKLHTLYLKTPGAPVGEVFAKLEVYMWLGVTKYVKNNLSSLPEEFKPLYEQASFSTPIPSNMPPSKLCCDDSRYFQLRAHLYQARGILAADDNGLSDPFAKVVFSTQCQVTRMLEGTLSPTWSELLFFDQILMEGSKEDLRRDPPVIVINLYDYDKIGSPEFIGRAFAGPEVKLIDEPYSKPALQFYDITKGKTRAGELLAAFELIELDYSGYGEPSVSADVVPKEPDYLVEQNYYPIPEGVRPKLRPFRVEVLYWGLRDLKRVNLFEVERPQVKIECAGKMINSEEITDYKQNPNFTELVQHFDVELPELVYLHPPLTIFVLEQRAFGRMVLVGTHVVQSLMQFAPKDLEELNEEEEEPEQKEKKPEKIVNPLNTVKNMDLGSLPVAASKIPINPINLVSKTMSKVPLKIPKQEELEEEEPEKEELDWWSKYYASLEELEKKNTEEDDDNEDHQEADGENLNADSLDVVEEDLTANTEPEPPKPKRKSIAVLTLYKSELENEFQDFMDWLHTFPIYKGKANCDEEDEDDEERTMGKYKGSFLIYPKEEAEEEPECRIIQGAPKNMPIKVLP